MARHLRFFSSPTPTTVPTRRRQPRLSFSFSSWATSSRRPWCRSAPAARTTSNAAAAPSAVKAADGSGAARRKHMLAASLSGIGGKAAAMAKMVSWNRRSPSGGSSDEDEEAAVVEDEEALWRKAILMGEKCRPLEFSGHIGFDSDGNQLPPAPAKKGPDDVAQN